MFFCLFSLFFSSSFTLLFLNFRCLFISLFIFQQLIVCNLKLLSFWSHCIDVAVLLSQLSLHLLYLCLESLNISFILTRWRRIAHRRCTYKLTTTFAISDWWRCAIPSYPWRWCIIIIVLDVGVRKSFDWVKLRWTWHWTTNLISSLSFIFHYRRFD